jgi:hypothetical protein
MLWYWASATGAKARASFLASASVCFASFVESSLGSSDSISEVARSIEGEGEGEGEALPEDVAPCGVAGSKGVEGRMGLP